MTPMGVGDEIYGTITFVIDPERAGFEEDDVPVAEDVARRAGVAIERRALYLGARSPPGWR